MQTSVIIPVFNQVKYTKNLISTMLALTPPNQLIVVDNGSTDETSEYLRLVHDECEMARVSFKTVTFSENMGFGRAMNAGLRESSGDCKILLNNDVKIVTTDWLDEIAREVGEDHHALFGPQLITNNRLTQMRDLRYIPYLSGFLFAFHSTVYWGMESKGQFFDERFFAYYEDVDITRRAWERGCSVKTIEDIGLYHYGGRTGFSLPNQPDILKASRKAYADKWGVEWMPMSELGETE